LTKWVAILDSNIGSLEDIVESNDEITIFAPQDDVIEGETDDDFVSRHVARGTFDRNMIKTLACKGTPITMLNGTPLRDLVGISSFSNDVIDTAQVKFVTIHTIKTMIQEGTDCKIDENQNEDEDDEIDMSPIEEEEFEIEETE